MKRIIIVVLASALIAPACVTTKEYDRVVSQRDALKKELADERESCANKLGASEAELVAARKAHAAELAKCEEAAQRLDEQITHLEQKQAALLKDKSTLKAEVAELAKALEALRAQRAAAAARVARYKELLSRFKSMIDAGQLKVRIVDGRMVLDLPTDILFPSGSARLSEAGQEAITKVAKILIDMGERKLRVAGHTDNVPIRSERYPNNWVLGAGRAVSVVELMVDGGMSPERMSAASYGEYQPVASNETKEGRRQNRRIEIELVPDLSVMPGAEELEKLGWWRPGRARAAAR